MKLKVSALFAAYLTLTEIINGVREMPQKGKYRIARLHEQLTPEFKVAADQRDKLITEHGTEILTPGPVVEG